MAFNLIFADRFKDQEQKQKTPKIEVFLNCFILKIQLFIYCLSSLFSGHPKPQW